MRIVVLCGLVLTMLCTAVAFGEDTIGGVFFRDLRITNNGKTVFHDDFNKDELKGWSLVNTGVSTTPASDNPAKLCLYMNRQTDEKSGISRQVECSNVGALELSAYVYLPAPEEQWAYTHGSSARTRIDIETGRGQDSFFIPIDLYPDESGYRIGLDYFKPEQEESAQGAEKYEPEDVAIAPQKWTLLSFKLDPATRTATVSVDGKAKVSCSYSPEKISKLDYVDLTTWMGDHERVGEAKEPVTAKPSGSKSKQTNNGQTPKKNSGGCNCGGRKGGGCGCGGGCSCGK